MTRHIRRPLAALATAAAVFSLMGGWLVLGAHEAGAMALQTSHPVVTGRHGLVRHHALVRHRAIARRRTHMCRRNVRSVSVLPTPLVSYETPYVPGPCDPMRLLPKEARRLFACVRWREGGDMANQPNGAGMYQFTNRATWDEFKGSFPEVPSQATPFEQDVVAYRAWKAEQFLPWNGDPCLGSVHQLGRWGWY